MLLIDDHSARAPMTTAAASAKLDCPERVLAAPVKGVPVGVGGTTADVPVAPIVAFALEALADPVPVTRGMRTGAEVVVATGDEVEASMTVL